MNILTKILLPIAIVMIATSAFAQTQTMVDVVYCKNGSVIKGTIIEQTPNQSLKIQTLDGNVFVYAMEDVEKITKEQRIEQTTTQTNVQNETSTLGNYDICFKAEQDAGMFYKNKGAYRGGIWATTLLFTPLGLIPTIAAVASDLSPAQLNMHDTQLMNNPQYVQCYKDAAKKKRNKASWSAFGIAAGLNIVLGLLLIAY